VFLTFRSSPSRAGAARRRWGRRNRPPHDHPASSSGPARPPRPPLPAAPAGPAHPARKSTRRPHLQANAGRGLWLGRRVFEASKTSAARRTGWIRGAGRSVASGGRDGMGRRGLGRARQDGKRRRRARRGEAGRVRWRRGSGCLPAQHPLFFLVRRAGCPVSDFSLN
jgi:hypothetical protein